MDENKDACESCRFFKLFNDDFGTCRKNPPVINSYGEGLFPSIRKTNWCGEYRSRGKQEDLEG